MHRSAWGVVAALLLGLVFVLSSVTKLARSAQWRTQSSGLGVPWPVAAPVPYAEAVLGGLLVAQVQRHAVAWCALVVLSAFTALLVVRLGQGRRPPCACFGALSVRPIGPSTVARNAAFMAVAVAAALL